MHVTNVKPVGKESPWHDGPYQITCTCGETVTYSGKYFTEVEAQRHRRWHDQQEGRTFDVV